MKLWRRGRSGLDDDRAFCKPAPHPTKDPSMTVPSKHLPIETPEALGERRFTDAGEAVAYLVELYDTATGFLREKFRAVVQDGGMPPARYRAFYPEIRITTTTYSQVDSRLAFGHVAEPGTYMTTVTRPDLFGNYLRQQIALLIQNHGVPVYVGPSATPIPVHFAVLNDAEVQVPQEGAMSFPLRDAFDVPDLQSTHDDIVNGFGFTYEDGSGALAPFTAQRIDYSLARLSHYTATLPEHFQNHVLFTNYQFYMDEFVAFARAALADPDSGYTSLVGPGNDVITNRRSAAEHAL
jgi:AMP nucleosidase